MPALEHIHDGINCSAYHHHPVLSRVYPHVFTLSAYFQSLFPPRQYNQLISAVAEQLASAAKLSDVDGRKLTRDEQLEKARDKATEWMDAYLVGVHESPPPQQDTDDESQCSTALTPASLHSLQDLIFISQQILLAQRPSPSSKHPPANILTLGYRPADERSSSFRLPLPLPFALAEAASALSLHVHPAACARAITNYALNTSLTHILESPLFHALADTTTGSAYRHSALLVHIFTSTSLFRRIDAGLHSDHLSQRGTETKAEGGGKRDSRQGPHQCYFQLCGRPLPDVVQAQAQEALVGASNGASGAKRKLRGHDGFLSIRNDSTEATAAIRRKRTRRGKTRGRSQWVGHPAFHGQDQQQEPQGISSLIPPPHAGTKVSYNLLKCKHPTHCASISATGRVSQACAHENLPRAPQSKSGTCWMRPLTSIALVRSRTFYARPTLDRMKKVCTGLPPSHVFQRSRKAGMVNHCYSSDPHTAVGASQNIGGLRVGKGIGAAAAAKFIFPRLNSSSKAFSHPEGGGGIFGGNGHRQRGLGRTTSAASSRDAVSDGLGTTRRRWRAHQTQTARRARHVLKYIFPRQYGLHNVFTSATSASGYGNAAGPGLGAGDNAGSGPTSAAGAGFVTAQRFVDYVSREAEIAYHVARRGRRPKSAGMSAFIPSSRPPSTVAGGVPARAQVQARTRPAAAFKTPWRLKPVLPIVHHMLQRHDRLNYRALLNRCAKNMVPRRMSQEERTLLARSLAEVADRPDRTHVHRSGGCGNADRNGHGDGVDTSSKLDVAAEVEGDASHEWRKVKRAEQRRSGHEETDSVKKAVAMEHLAKPVFQHFVVMHTQVTRFAIQVFRYIIPNAMLGSKHNRRVLEKSIKLYVTGRRYETVTLHQLLQGIRLSDISWLQPAGRTKTTREDDLQRRSILAELIYYLFDSILTPLLRTTFYATEATAFRNRVLYFRQDDWLSLSGPLLARVRDSLFSHVPKKEALAIMSSRKLGYSHIRLLPKERGVRAIVNLRRRSTKQTPTSEEREQKSMKQRMLLKASDRSGSAPLGNSINQVLQATFNILTYEKKAQADAFASSVLGPNEIFRHLKDFRANILSKSLDERGRMPHLFFVKMDVRTAFDTIDQERLLSIVRQLLKHDGYYIQRYTQAAVQGAEVKVNFKKHASPANQLRVFEDFAQELAEALRYVIFIDGVISSHEQHMSVLQLLEQHITGNLVKIGRDFYRQQIGIPQGSSLSTLLCSFFYADLEREHLGFVRKPGSLLLRYTDDFLFVTTVRARAERFVEVMSAGHPDYGCFVSEEKTLTNFQLSFKNGGFVPRVLSEWFPWCGYLVNTRTLAVRSDLDRYKEIDMHDTLTVERGKQPGKAMLAKLMQSLKSRAHIIFNDTALNDAQSIATNIYQAFLVAAMKLRAYLHSLSSTNSGWSAEFLFNLVKAGVHFAPKVILARAKRSKRLHSQAVCRLNMETVAFLGFDAFKRIFRIRQHRRYRAFLLLLENQQRSVRSRRVKLRHVRDTADQAWKSSYSVVMSMKF